MLHPFTTRAAPGLCAFLLGSALAAQTATGTVRDFAGEPAAGAMVRAIDGGGTILGEGLSDDAGEFALLVAGPIARLRVQLEAVAVERVLAGGSAARLEVAFAAEPCERLHGRVVDPGGAPAARCDLLLRDAARRTIASATTDATGAFALRANQVVHDVVIDPGGWRAEVRAAPGPDGLVLDLRTQRERFFQVRGRVLDDGGAAAADWRIVARGERTRAAVTTTRADGTFALWSTLPIEVLEAHAGTPRLGRLGAWRSDVELELDERRDALVLVTGRFTTTTGEPVARALVIPTMTAAPPAKGTPAIGGTDADGRFAVRVLAGTKFLFVVHEADELTALGAVPAAGQPLLLRAK